MSRMFRHGIAIEYMSFVLFSRRALHLLNRFPVPDERIRLILFSPFSLNSYDTGVTVQENQSAKNSTDRWNSPDAANLMLGVQNLELSLTH